MVKKAQKENHKNVTERAEQGKEEFIDTKSKSIDTCMRN